MCVCVCVRVCVCVCVCDVRACAYVHVSCVRFVRAQFLLELHKHPEPSECVRGLLNLAFRLQFAPPAVLKTVLPLVIDSPHTRARTPGPDIPCTGLCRSPKPCVLNPVP